MPGRFSLRTLPPAGSRAAKRLARPVADVATSSTVTPLLEPMTTRITSARLYSFCSEFSLDGAAVDAELLR